MKNLFYHSLKKSSFNLNFCSVWAHSSKYKNCVKVSNHIILMYWVLKCKMISYYVSLQKNSSTFEVMISHLFIMNSQIQIHKFWKYQKLFCHYVISALEYWWSLSEILKKKIRMLMLLWSQLIKFVLRKDLKLKSVTYTKRSLLSQQIFKSDFWIMLC